MHGWRFAAVTVAAVGAALTLAFPAGADDVLTGTYALAAQDDAPAAWSIVSSCTPSCVATVKSSRGWRGYANLSDGRWTMTVYLGPNLMSAWPAQPTCVDDGPVVPMSRTWSWDAATLKGTVETASGDACGAPLTISSAPMALVKVD
jgi:hypothetical protein